MLLDSMNRKRLTHLAHLLALVSAPMRLLTFAGLHPATRLRLALWTEPYPRGTWPLILDLATPEALVGRFFRGDELACVLVSRGDEPARFDFAVSLQRPHVAL